MLNLHQMVRGAINAVNPDQPVIILQSDGFDVAGYEQRPKWKPAVSVMAQCRTVVPGAFVRAGISGTDADND